MDKNSRFCNILNEWLCKECMECFYFKLEALKREYLKENPSFKYEFELLPPPWDFVKYLEKTEGWMEYQKEMKKHPEYYLRNIGYDKKMLS
ncbi:MAG TPA: hypothetical protein VK462_06950 [Nitrososphaeraceae archaeon]|nr:hypothetical protein [Nitrososphaeraceae archaeon]